jgi:nicotinamide mononucleotide transporter
VNQIELVAALLGLVNVVLTVRRSVLNYPFGIAMVSLYFFIFVDVRLYSDALLQLFFLVIQLYGWWNWSRSSRAAGGVAVDRLPAATRLWWLLGTLAGSLAWGLAMARFTDAAAPYIDAMVAGFSISAQSLLALRKVESWALWIAVDVVAVGLFLSRGLAVTAALYCLFLALAVSGLIAWSRRLPPVAAAVAE